MNSDHTEDSHLKKYCDEKRKEGEPHEQQTILFQHVLAHVDNQVRAQMDKVTLDDKTKVLIIYTGGTIGMVNTEEGYTVEKGFLLRSIKANSYLCDTSYTASNAEQDFIVTPMSIYKKRIWFKLIEFDEIRDSSTFDTEDWVNIATVIEKNYDDYNAFVILHGTDTMAYTASALSFMFENLNKTIVLTGSQVPLSEMRNDAFENLLGAITIAGHFTIPEVTIFFQDKLYRGNRASKIDTFELAAFDSPNINPLGTFGFYLKLDWSLIRKPPVGKLIVHKELSKKVGVLKFFPMIPADMLDSMFQTSAQAFVIEAYGAGNLPVNRPDIASAIGKTIVVITQCRRGSVSTLYAIGKHAKDLGIVSGLDMTVECAVAKLSYLLGKGYSNTEITKEVQEDLRGELTKPNLPNFGTSQFTFIKTISDAINMDSEHQSLKDAVFPTILSYAAEFGYVNILQEVKKNGFSLELGNYEGNSPLHIAAQKGNILIMNFLVEEGVPLNTVNKAGKSPLYEAVYYKHFDAVKVLVKNGAVVKVDQEDLSDYLFKMAAKGDLDSLKLFFYAGIKDLNKYVNVDKRSVAHVAVSEGKSNIVGFLKDEVNFDFNVKDRWGKTPLDEAIRIGNQAMIKLLKENKET